VKQTELEVELTRYLALVEIEPSPGEISLLAHHIELVLDANQRVNLTRIVDPHDAVRLHTADSLTVLEDLALAPEGPLLDLGAGAGFPGIPLAICSTRDVLLIDSVSKKVRELSAMINALKLSDRVRAASERAEALGRENPAEYAVITARAVSELPALVELASPLLVPDGRLICLKGSPEESEVSRAAEVAKIVGLRLDYQRSLDLPEGVGHRTVLCYRKVGGSRVPLPRREGMAQHSPLV